MSWDDCGAAGASRKDFACANNGLSNALIVSAIPPVAMAALSGAETTILVATAGATLPAWWQMQPGGCRGVFAALGSTADFTIGYSGCADPWLNQAANAQAFDYPAPGSGLERGRIRTLQAVPLGSELAVDGSTEIYIVKVFIGHAKSTGPGACEGCADGACLVLQGVTLIASAGGESYTLTEPLLRQHVLWQNGGAVAGGCPGATPAWQPTWGAVKSMYR